MSMNVQYRKYLQIWTKLIISAGFLLRFVHVVLGTSSQIGLEEWDYQQNRLSVMHHYNGTSSCYWSVEWIEL